MLSWTTVPAPAKYGVYRTEGVFGCDFGKVLLGETFGTTWEDGNLQNGRQYLHGGSGGPVEHMSGSVELLHDRDACRGREHLGGRRRHGDPHER